MTPFVKITIWFYHTTANYICLVPISMQISARQWKVHPPIFSGSFTSTKHQEREPPILPKLTMIFFPLFSHIHTTLVPKALAMWQLSPVNTDSDFQYITALEIIIFCRVDSKTPPGTLGCQLQRGTAAKVTGLLPYGQPGRAQQSCSADTHTTSGQSWSDHRLVLWVTKGARWEAWGV